MGGSSNPPAPNYVGAATAQGAANKEVARISAKMNNPNVINPLGSQTVTWNNDIPTLTQTLSPEQQKILGLQEQAQQNIGAAGIASSAQLSDILGSGLDLSKLPEYIDPQTQYKQDVIDAMMSRVKEDSGQNRDAMQSRLIAAGIRPGTEAYAREMTQLDRQYNDAYNNALLAAGQESTAQRQQALAEMLTQRQTPLNEAIALQTGTQVSNPFAGGLGYQAGTNIQAAPTYQAAVNQGQAQQNQYNASQAYKNNLISSGAGLLGSLGSAYLTYP